MANKTKMFRIDDFIEGFSLVFPEEKNFTPWEITENLKTILQSLIVTLGDEYHIQNGVAIHRSAVIESGVVIKGPAIIGAECYVCANGYFREGAYLLHSVKTGPGCEIKNSIIFPESATAHFNYIGNSIIGRQVNFEAGSVAANHYNERKYRMISVKYKSEIIETGVEKFGSLVGDYSKIGANAVLSPGTLLEKNSVVKRLELISQIGESDHES